MVGLGRIRIGTRRAARRQNRLEETAVRQPNVPELSPVAVDVTAALMSSTHNRAGRQQVLRERRRLRAVAANRGAGLHRLRGVDADDPDTYVGAAADPSQERVTVDDPHHRCGERRHRNLRRLDRAGIDDRRSRDTVARSPGDPDRDDQGHHSKYGEHSTHAVTMPSATDITAYADAE